MTALERDDAHQHVGALAVASVSPRAAASSRLPVSATAFALSLPVRIRRCREEDLLALEWFGTFTHHRELIRKAFARQEEGEVLMLVAMLANAPIGQAWVDLARSREPRTGWIWSLRVFPWLCNRGVGSRLLHAAECAISRAGCTGAELSVEQRNTAARRLYERRGYKRVRTLRGEHACTTPWGAYEHHQTREILMRKSLTRLAADEGNGNSGRIDGPAAFALGRDAP